MIDTPEFDLDQISSIEDILVERGRTTSIWRQRKARLLLSGDDLHTFYESLAELRRREERLNEAIVHIWDIQTSGGTKRLGSPLAVIIPVILYRLHQQGQQWHIAFRDWLPANDLMVLSSTPQTGLSHQLLTHMAEETALANANKAKVSKAFAPLLVTVVAMIAFVYGAGIYYFPKLLKSIPYLVPRGQVKWLLDTSHWMLTYGYFLLPALAAIPFLVRYVAPRFTGVFRRFIDGWPVISIYKETTGVSFIHTLATLVRADLRVPAALAQIANNATPYIRERVEPAILMDDIALGEALETSGFDWPNDHIIRQVKLYMSGRDPEEGLQRLSVYARAQLNARLESFAGWTNWIGMIAMSAFALWIMALTNDISDQAKASALSRTHMPAAAGSTAIPSTIRPR